MCSMNARKQTIRLTFVHTIWKVSPWVLTVQKLRYHFQESCGTFLIGIEMKE